VSDPQDHAESFDEDAIGSSERRLSDAAEVDYLRNVDSPAVVDQDRWYYYHVSTP
jgi:hypothetical protein